MWGGLFGLSVNLVITLLRLGVLGFGAWLILEGRFTTGGLVAFLAIMGEVLAPVTVLVTLSQDIQASMGSLIRINEIIDATTESVDEHLPAVPPLTRNITLSGVGLSYTPERRALDEVDLTIPAGSRVAFVGPSGSGKSTVLRLLMRLYEPDEGRITVDGVDISEGSLHSWRDQIGVVFQDSFLFDATLRENIALGRAGATDSEIRAAAAAAGVESFVTSLAHGWDTLVGDGGSNLSGGQRQRVALARALVRQPRLLILDEATSALDPATERQICDTIRQIGDSRTVVSVTHRLASVADYDMIVVIDDGRVTERGTHDQLLQRRGIYARLWAEQTGTPMPDLPPFDAIAALSRIPMLARLDPPRLAGVATRLVPFSLPTGRRVAEGDGLMFVVAGRADVVVGSTPDGETVDAELRPGDAFGVSAMMGSSRRATLRASEPTELLHLPSQVLSELALTATNRTTPDSGAPPWQPPHSAKRLSRMTTSRPVATPADPGGRAPTVAVFAPPRTHG